MHITLKSTRSEKTYDISDAKQAKQLEQALAAKRRQQNFPALVAAVLQQVQTLRQAQAQPNATLDQLKIILEKYQAALAQQQAYVPYTQQLQAHFIAARATPNMPVTKQAALRQQGLTKYENAATLAAYLARSVSAKAKSAQDNVEQISACFWFDFLRTAHFLQKDNDNYELILIYLALIQQFYTHNASTYTAQGYGKHARIDVEAMLYYFRSQDAHPTVSVAHRTRQLFAAAAEREPHDYALQNAAQNALVLSSLTPGNAYQPDLAVLDERGILPKSPSAGYFGAFLGYVGSRANNVRLRLEALQHAFAKRANRRKALGEVVPETKGLPAKPIDKPTRTAMLTAALDKLAPVRAALQAYSPAVDLANKLSQTRSRQAQQLVAATQELTQIKLSHPAHASFVVIEFYPEFTGSERESDNFKEGLTNVFIGFLTGLINYNLQQQGLHTRLERRQSFGFLRATVTDMGSLRMRLSLGAEPPAVTQVITQSLAQFNALLAQHDFTASNTQRTPLVQDVMQPSERARGRRETEKTGKYCLTAMRSERDQWAAVLMAQHLLHQQAGQADVPLTAFEAYLQDFIVARVDYEKVRDKASKSLATQGFTFPIAAQQQIREAEDVDPVIFAILTNVMHYATSAIADLDRETLPASYSLYFVLQKILHNCQKGAALLAYQYDYEQTHMCAKANLLVENLLEHLILLRFLTQPQAFTDEQGTTLTQQLRTFEQQHWRGLLDVPEQALEVFYNDSGQQALTASLLSFAKQCRHDKKAAMEVKLCMFSNTYYEVTEFIDKTKQLALVGMTRQGPPQAAHMWMVDITQLAQLQAATQRLQKAKRSQLHTVILDVTNNSSPALMQQARTTIQTLRARGVWVVIVNSSLKHEQLGLDKYQSGKTIVLKPTNKTLCDEVKGHLQAIAKHAIHPLTAAYRQMVESIFNATSSPACRETKDRALTSFGVFSLGSAPAQAAAVKTTAPSNTAGMRRA